MALVAVNMANMLNASLLATGLSLSMAVLYACQYTSHH
jgi:CBS-domain-containing membrane protein